VQTSLTKKRKNISVDDGGDRIAITVFCYYLKCRKQVTSIYSFSTVSHLPESCGFLSSHVIAVESFMFGF
jgi:hypothetical protein